MNSNKNKLSSKIILIFNPSARLGPTDAFAFFSSFFFFFNMFWDKFYYYGYCSCTVHEQQPQSLTCQTIFSQSVHTVHCSRNHKFHFSATFSLKIGPTVLFIYLKIILLQCFSVFSFSFQFSAVSKWTLDNKSSPRLGHQLSPLVFS